MRAVAGEVGQSINTGAMHTGGVLTKVDPLGAVGPVEALRTVTAEASCEVKANTAVGTVLASAIVDSALAVMACFDYHTNHD